MTDNIVKLDILKQALRTSPTLGVDESEFTFFRINKQVPDELYELHIVFKFDKDHTLNLRTGVLVETVDDILYEAIPPLLMSGMLDFTQLILVVEYCEDGKYVKSLDIGKFINDLLEEIDSTNGR